ncbi:hypothetical protein DFH09DRAFT_1414136 [Mycena vulgaris]|nr:hypothetical protein DFH09DRAFT_1414136 [Mycena vulgaris]
MRTPGARAPTQRTRLGRRGRHHAQGKQTSNAAVPTMCTEVVRDGDVMAIPPSRQWTARPHPRTEKEREPKGLEECAQAARERGRIRRGAKMRTPGARARAERTRTARRASRHRMRRCHNDVHRGVRGLDEDVAAIPPSCEWTRRRATPPRPRRGATPPARRRRGADGGRKERESEERERIRWRSRRDAVHEPLLPWLLEDEAEEEEAPRPYALKSMRARMARARSAVASQPMMSYQSPHHPEAWEGYLVCQITTGWLDILPLHLVAMSTSIPEQPGSALRPNPSTRRPRDPRGSVAAARLSLASRSSRAKNKPSQASRLLGGSGGLAAAQAGLHDGVAAASDSFRLLFYPLSELVWLTTRCQDLTNPLDNQWSSRKILFAPAFVGASTSNSSVVALDIPAASRRHPDLFVMGDVISLPSTQVNPSTPSFTEEVEDEDDDTRSPAALHGAAARVMLLLAEPDTDVNAPAHGPPPPTSTSRSCASSSPPPRTPTCPGEQQHGPHGTAGSCGRRLLRGRAGARVGEPAGRYNRPPRAGDTWGSCASRSRCPAWMTVELLLHAGASVNAPDVDAPCYCYGYTAMSVAAERGSLLIVLLIHPVLPHSAALRVAFHSCRTYLPPISASTTRPQTPPMTQKSLRKPTPTLTRVHVVRGDTIGCERGTRATGGNAHRIGMACDAGEVLAPRHRMSGACTSGRAGVRRRERVGVGAGLQNIFHQPLSSFARARQRDHIHTHHSYLPTHSTQIRLQIVRACPDRYPISWRTRHHQGRCDKDRGAMFREGGGGETGAGRETECVNPPSRGFRGGFNVDKSWSYGDGVARKRTIPADRERQFPRIRHIELLRQQIRQDLVSKPRRNSRFRQDLLTDQQDLGCGLIGSCFRARTRPKMDELSCVLSVSVLYPAGARWLSLRGQSARIQASLRAYPGGFPWVEPVSCKVQTVGGIQDVWGMCAKSRGIEFVRMLVALELHEIPREEVAGGAVGVVRGGFPRGGAQRSVTAALMHEGIRRAYGTLTARTRTPRRGRQSPSQNPGRYQCQQAWITQVSYRHPVKKRTMYEAENTSGSSCVSSSGIMSLQLVVRAGYTGETFTAAHLLERRLVVLARFDNDHGKCTADFSSLRETCSFRWSWKVVQSCRSKQGNCREGVESQYGTRT